MSEALARFDGKEELLKRMAGLFLEDCPSHMDSIRKAVTHRDSRALARAAHGLKGTVGIFAASGAVDSAERLERMARAGDLARVEDAHSALETKIERLTRRLSAFLENAETPGLSGVRRDQPQRQ